MADEERIWREAVADADMLDDDAALLGTTLLLRGDMTAYAVRDKADARWLLREMENPEILSPVELGYKVAEWPK